MAAFNLNSVQSLYSLLNRPRTTTIVLQRMCQKNRQKHHDGYFDLTDPYASPPAYNSLLDSHLKSYYSTPTKFQHLVRSGMITQDGFVVCYEHRDRSRQRRPHTGMSATPALQAGSLTSSEVTAKPLQRSTTSQIEQRLQKVRELNNEKQRRAEIEKKRKQKVFRMEQEMRQRVLNELKRDRAIKQARIEKEAERRQKLRLIHSNEEGRRKAKLLAQLKSVEAERRQRYENQKQEARKEKQRKLEKKFVALLEEAKRRQIYETENQQEENRKKTARLQERRLNDARRYAKQQKQEEHLKAAKRQAVLESHRQARLFLEDRKRQRDQHLTKFSQKHWSRYQSESPIDCQMSPVPYHDASDRSSISSNSVTGVKTQQQETSDLDKSISMLHASSRVSSTKCSSSEHKDLTMDTKALERKSLTVTFAENDGVNLDANVSSNQEDAELLLIASKLVRKSLDASTDHFLKHLYSTTT